jgi:hypothetical protein
MRYAATRHELPSGYLVRLMPDGTYKSIAMFDSWRDALAVAYALNMADSLADKERGTE